MQKSAIRYGTQGGGEVIWEDGARRYVFVVAPPCCPELKVGDYMPEEWGTGGVINPRENGICRDCGEWKEDCRCD